MTRLESGAIAPNTAPHDLSARSSAARCGARRRSWPSTSVEVELAADLPMLELDPVLFEQVLFNLLDNAAKYAPRRHHDPHPGVAGRADCGRAPGAGRGRRHPARRARAASSTSSTACRRATTCAPAPGSGSPICRGFVEAMGGTIRAAQPGRPAGAVFTDRPAGAGGIAAADWMPPHDCARASSPGHRRRAADPPAPADGPGHAGLSRPRGAERQAGARAARAERARADHPRSRPARHRRPRPAADDPRAATKACRSSCCRAAATRPARSRRSISAPTTT